MNHSIEVQHCQVFYFNYLIFVEKYIDHVLEVLDDMLQDKTIQANCVCLYAYYKIARGEVMKVRININGGWMYVWRDSKCMTGAMTN